MSRERILLIVAGTGLIILVVAIAAFSLGVYAGVHGWTAEAPAVARPVQQPAAPAAAVQPAAGAPGAGQRPGGQQPGALAAGQGAEDGQQPAVPATGQGVEDGQPLGAQAPAAPRNIQPQLVGRVRSRGDDTVTLDTPQGPRLCHLAPDVQVDRVVEGEGEVAASLDQVQPGRRLAVFGQFGGDGAQRLIAHRLLLLPQAQLQP